MKILNFEHPDNPSIRQNMIDTINQNKACLLICNSKNLTFQWVGLCHEQVIAALELVKMSVLKEMGSNSL